MINLVIPLAGKGQRFVDAGYKIPKALITVGNKTNIEWSLKSLKLSDNVRPIFVIRPDQDANYDLGYVLKSKFGSNTIIQYTNGYTRGAVETCMAAANYFSNNEPLAIYCPDVYFEPQLELTEELFKDNDGSVLVFKANSTAYSYVKFDETTGIVERTAEKQIISPYAAVGLYLFSSGEQFLTAAYDMLRHENTVQNEYYVCPLYNSIIHSGKKITAHIIDKVHIFGTPAEMKFFVNNTIRTFEENKRIVGLCTDHSGFEIKEAMKKILNINDIPYIDFGTFSPKDCDYSVYVNECTEAVLANRCSFGMGFCRTGQGVNIAANRTPGIRGALIYSLSAAEYAIRHNCANFFSIPAASPLELDRIVVKWKENTFDGGRHQNRLQDTEI